MTPLFEPPESHPLGQLFDTKAPFMVDSYQRDYAWTYRAQPKAEADDGEVADFIYDLKRLVDAAIRDPDVPPYFFGLVVAAQQPNTDWIPRVKHEVVDGQQRLSTFALLASAMIDVAESIRLDAVRLGQTDAARRCANFKDLLTSQCIARPLKSTTGRDPKPFDVLTLTTNDDSFFQKLIRNHDTGDASRESCVLLARAKVALVAAIEEWLPAGTPAEREDRLTRIRNIIFEKTEVILITAKNTVDAYRLFAVSNNRGKKLEQADLLRAYLLRLVSTSSDPTVPRDVAAAWNELDARTPDTVNAVLRAYYASVVGLRAPKVDVFDAFARDIFKHSENDALDDTQAETVKTAVEAIREAANLYDKLAHGEWPYAAGKKGASDWERHLLGRVVNNLRSLRSVPLLLAAATEWKNSEKDFTKLMRFLERADFRLLVSNAHQSTVADRYFEAAGKVRRGQNPDDIIAFLEVWVASLADDSAFNAGLNALNYRRSARRIRHLLAMLDDYLPSYDRFKKTGVAKLRSNELRSWNLGSADIDHVYPQSATRDAQLAAAKHRLGNLTLLLDVDNRVEAKKLLPTNRKKTAIYKTSLVRLTERLGEHIELKGWNHSELEARQQELVLMAEFVYQLSSSAKAEAKKLELQSPERSTRRTKIS